MSKWIKCSDRLPEDDVLVLATDGNSVGIGRCNWGIVEYLWIIQREFGKITHWQPLPEPPEREDWHEKSSNIKT